MTDATAAADARPLQVEMNGINVIAESERKGRPHDLFWPWFAANVSVLGLSYGSFVLGFGISFWQAVVVGVVGIVLSFLACGFIAVAGKRGSAPTMVLSRAAFGVNGNKLPAVISWVLTVGWETVLVVLATLATATVFARLGWGGGDGTKVVALIVVVALTILGGVMGFDLIMRMQTWITLVTGVFTVVFIALVADKIHWHTVSGIHGGSSEAVIRRRRDLVDHVRLLHRAHLPAGVRPAAGGVVEEPVHGDPERSHRGAGHPAAHLVPGAVRDRGRARADRRLGARHLLLGPGPAHPRPAGAQVPGRADRRHRDDPRHHLRGVLHDELRVPVRGIPDHAGRADRRLVRGHAGGHRAAAARLRRARAVHLVGPLRRRQVAAGAGGHRVHRDRLGPGHQWLGQLADLAGLSARPVRPGRQEGS